MITLLHITLNTGHCRASYPAEVDPLVMVTARGLVHRMLRKQLGHPVAIPGVRGYLLSGQSAGGNMVATVWHALDLPILSMGVCTDAVSGANLWRTLHMVQGLATNVHAQPRSPWLGVVLLPGMVQTPPEAMAWLGDLERCLGHAWMEILTTNN